MQLRIPLKQMNKIENLKKTINVIKEPNENCRNEEYNNK